MPKFNKPDSPNIIWGVNALDADLTKPSDSYIQTGWTQVKPPYEYENYSMNKLYQGFAYYNQMGIPEWDSVTEYQSGKSYVQGSNNRVYKCIQTHTNKNPATAGNEAYWERLRVTDTEIKTLFNANNEPPVFACRAFVSFSGDGSLGAATLSGSGNISSVTKTGLGRYTVSFNVPMPDSSYAVTGMCSDDDHVVAIESTSRTPSSFDVVTTDAGVNNQEFSDTILIMLSVFR